MENLLYLGLFLPLAGFLILLLLSLKANRTLISLVGCLSILGSFICFSALLIHFIQNDQTVLQTTLFNWISVEQAKTDFNLHLDHLSLLMSLIITGVGFLIHVYSIGYMDHDEDDARYFACMNLFVFAMLLLVLAGNLLLLFVGWEGVGLASYLLIGYYTTRNSAAAAAVKAFVVNRIGDCGLLIGLLLTYYLFGTSDIVYVNNHAKEVNVAIITLLTLLYFVGAIGKSAQLPLYVWLPDAMEGPTPVSALIHAATMVTAGVYLIVRLNPVFSISETTMTVVGVVGALSALFAALCALAQTDIKRVLAYSTMSQLGLMFVACGVGGYYAAMFHLTTHAFVKALLFLTAGIVIHMMSGTTDLSKMGGLIKRFPVSTWLFLLGVLALSGLPPLAPFFSKDLIIEEAHLSGRHYLFYISLAASILTAIYMTRAFVLAFLGESHLDQKNAKHVKEGPWIMLIPVLVLAVFAIFAGFLGYTFSDGSILQNFLKPIGISKFEQEIELNFSMFETFSGALASLGAVFGILIGYLFYTRTKKEKIPKLNLLKEAFHVDAIYDKGVVTPLKGVACAVDRGLEPSFFQGSIDQVATGVYSLTNLFKKLQDGEIRSYLAYMVLGASIFIIYLVW